MMWGVDRAVVVTGAASGIGSAVAERLTAEVADVIAFLLGPSGRSFTGVPVTMDHGWTAR